jgi:pilus assembly protein FimV
MAFGLGFNKTKVLGSAEKYVQQGKLQNAIAEYEKVLKNDPKDLTVLNTVGDLYSRLGQSEEACNCFKNVGDAYAQQGFTVKAIAMYKKLTKLRSTLETVLKLAELYTQQGLFNDARQQYLQVAEEFLRSGELDQAVRIFQKTLEMDPENVAMKVRLAEVYIRLKKKEEAWQIFSSAAEQLRAKGQLTAAEDILQRMLTLDPKNSQALLLRGRNALEGGDSAAAIHHLQQVPDLDSQPEGLKALLKAYLAGERLTEAGVLATKLLTVHNDIDGLSSFVDALMKGGLYQDALNIYHQYADRLMSVDQAKVLEHLHTIIGHVRNEPEALEVLLELFHKAGETTHITEVTELLAHASVQKGDLERARGLYQQLATLEPQNPIHTQNLQQVSAKLGGAPRAETISVEEGTVILDELEATAPGIDQAYPEQVSAAVRSALTDAELFVSYNMPAKALGPLMSALPQAPDDIRLNQRLAALHTRGGRFAEAAVSCRALEKVYSEAGYADESGRYSDLARRYEERAGVAAPQTAPEEIAPAVPEAAAPATSPWPAQFDIQPPSADHAEEPEHAAPVPSAAAAPTAHDEIDLSEEWDGAVSEEPSAAPVEEAPAPQPASATPAQPSDEELIPETVEEIRFYIQHSMRLQALAAMAKLEALSKDEQLIGTLRTEYEAAFAPAPAAHPAPPPEPLQEAPVEQVSVEEEPAPAAVAPPAPAPASLGDFAADLDAALGEDFEIAPAKLAKPAAKVALTPKVPELRPEPKPAPKKKEEPVPVASEDADVLGEFVADLEESLGDDFLPTAPSRPVPVAPARSAAAAAAAPAMAKATAAVATRVVQPAPKPQPVPVMATAPAAAPVELPAGGTDLIQMFDELKGELEEETATTAAEQDPETHYNLGVAFREMGLLDEAIGELQKVCHIVEKGHAFPQLMQTYTWLAQCFLDKGVPEAAIRWYEKALKMDTIDDDTRTALHYELASAYESANNREGALRHFMEVYGSNIDYRDVAERIKALKS